MEDLTVLDGCFEKLHGLRERILTILTRKNDDGVRGEQVMGGVGAQPVGDHSALPVIERQPIRTGERRAVGAVVSACGLRAGREEPECRQLVCFQGSSFQSGAP